MRNIRHRLNILRKIYPYAKKNRVGIALSFWLNILLVLLNFSAPLLFREFVNNVILNMQIDYLLTIVVGYLVIYILTTSISHLLLYVDCKWRNNIIMQMRKHIFDGYMSKCMHQYEEKEIVTIKMLLDEDSECLKGFLKNQSTKHVVQYLCFFITFAIMVAISWQLTLFAIVAIPITIVVDIYLGRKEGKLTAGNRDNNQKMYEWLSVSLNGWKEIKAFSLEKKQLDEFEDYHKYYADYYCKWINYWTARALVIPQIKNDFLMRLCLYFFGGLLIINHQLSIGNLLVYIGYYEILSNSLQTISSNNADLLANMPIVERVLKALADFEYVLNTSAPSDVKHVSYDCPIVAIKNVSFKYAAMDKTMFESFNLSIQRGDRIAVIGKSGCGKTTLLRLITGLILPNDGNIEIYGVDISSVHSNYINRHIGVVMQDSSLLNATIQQNLLLAKKDAEKEDLIRVCEEAYIMNTIKTMPLGFNTVIGERGNKLSGGEKQRICIARLLLRDVDLYCFDESTSALDDGCEEAIINAIHKIPDDKAVLFITHKPALLQMCNKVINLESKDD